jgi:serine/threonine-protein kinase RsbW
MTESSTGVGWRTGWSTHPAGVGIALTLRLPRDPQTVAVVRRLARDALDCLDVPAGPAEDIELALCEACTNAILHASSGSEYWVCVSVDPGRCVVEVGDAGSGFEFDVPSRVSTDAESGRGLALIDALVDEVHWAVETRSGTAVRMVKYLPPRDG